MTISNKILALALGLLLSVGSCSVMNAMQVAPNGEETSDRKRARDEDGEKPAGIVLKVILKSYVARVALIPHEESNIIKNLKESLQFATGSHSSINDLIDQAELTRQDVEVLIHVFEKILHSKK